MTEHKTLKNLPNNTRFYILATSGLLSLATTALLRLSIQSDQLFSIRLEQFFGLFSVLFLYVALVISPLTKAVGKRFWVPYVIFARRAVGVSAAYFATLHVLVALWGQIGGLSELALLPTFFKWSFALGAIAFVVLFAMAVTSLDKVIKFMTLPRWLILHRLVYFGSVFIILHVWMVGTHISYMGVRVAAFIALLVFVGLESHRVSLTLDARYKLFGNQQRRFLFFIALWLLWMAPVILLPRFVDNYHSAHHDSTGGHGAGH